MLRLLREGWAQALSTVVGVWLMAAPAILGYADVTAASAVHRVVGPTAAGFALVAIWGHMRPLRWVNVPLGLVLVAAPLVVTYPLVGAANSVAAGLLLVGLALVRGEVGERFGGGWSVLWTGNVAGEHAEAGPGTAPTDARSD